MACRVSIPCEAGRVGRRSEDAAAGGRGGRRHGVHVRHRRPGVGRSGGLHELRPPKGRNYRETGNGSAGYSQTSEWPFQVRSDDPMASREFHTFIIISDFTGDAYGGTAGDVEPASTASGESGAHHLARAERNQRRVWSSHHDQTQAAMGQPQLKLRSRPTTPMAWSPLRRCHRTGHEDLLLCCREHHWSTTKMWRRKPVLVREFEIETVLL